MSDFGQTPARRSVKPSPPPIACRRWHCVASACSLPCLPLRAALRLRRLGADRCLRARLRESRARRRGRVRDVDDRPGLVAVAAGGKPLGAGDGERRGNRRRDRRDLRRQGPRLGGGRRAGASARRSCSSSPPTPGWSSCSSRTARPSSTRSWPRAERNSHARRSRAVSPSPRRRRISPPIARHSRAARSRRTRRSLPGSGRFLQRVSGSCGSTSPR